MRLADKVVSLERQPRYSHEFVYDESPQMTKMTTDERDDLKMWARLHVRGGYEPLEEIEEILLDYAQDFRSPLTDRDRQIEVRNALVHAVSLLVQEQESWPILTDFDRLELAFDMLEDEDIVARQHFTCCGTCGAAEIGIEMDDFQDLVRPGTERLCLLPPAGHRKRSRKRQSLHQLRRGRRHGIS
jgi:hypothetical protein